MPYSIRLRGERFDNLTGKQAIAKAHALIDSGETEFDIFDSQGDRISLRQLEMVVGTVSFGD